MSLLHKNNKSLGLSSVSLCVIREVNNIAVVKIYGFNYLFFTV